MSASATAPGKVMLAGEYAVLEGYAAVVATLDRRVRARFGEEPSSSPLLIALAEELRTSHDVARAERATRIEVDSSALFDASGEKLGLGSSAAVAVAAASLALGSDDVGAVLSLALAAHRRMQRAKGNAGSGADIAAATQGGVVAVRKAGVEPFDIVPLAVPADLHLVLVWTGVPADTATLVAAVRRARDRPAYAAAIASIAAACTELTRGLQSGDARACVQAIDAGGRAHIELAEASGAPLIHPVHRQVRALAASRGGSAKPTGAGGGDVVLAAFADDEAAAAFKRDLELGGPGAGAKIIDTALDPRGVCFAPGA